MSDPFSEENIGIVQFIELARIYDVGMAILKELNKNAAADLWEVHKDGGIVGHSPYLSGHFLSDSSDD